MKSTIGIIQARIGSERLPAKVLLPLAGRSVLGWVVRGARESGALSDLIVATTTDPADDAVAEECRRLDVEVYRGPVDDVLTRFLGAVQGRDAGAIVRFTADNPLIDPAVIDAAVSVWRAAPWLDYVSTGLQRSLPHGMDVEIVRTEALRRLSETAAGHHRVHVTSGIYSDPEHHTLLGMAFSPNAADLRVTLDTADDWRVVQAVVDGLGDRPADLPSLIAWLRAHPDVATLNQHVHQKPLEAG
jgi:spore coat polysaccharide biosynthesis protein SpsF